MPTPGENESRDEFMSRCIPQVIDEGREQSQAVAICNSLWESGGKSREYDNDDDYIEIVDDDPPDG